MNKKCAKLLEKLESESKIKIWKDFEFPLSFDNGLRLKDLLEESVDERYYIPEEKCRKLLEELKDKQNGSVVIPVLTPDKHGVLLQVGLLDTKGNEQVRRVDSTDGISPTLNTMQGGNRKPKILEQPVAIQINHENLKIKSNDICSCLDANYWKGLDNHAARTGVLQNYRIRKLTPLECFRLMGFSDADYAILKSNNISNSQLYKMAGNSIVVDVLEAIFKSLFKCALG